MTGLSSPESARRGLGAALRAALDAFASQGLDQALRPVYQRLPDTECARRGQCCGLLPPVAPLEMLAWLANAASRAPSDRSHQVAILTEHFLTNAAQRRACPWALAGACVSYEHRFLACRAYGLWSPQVYASRRRAAQAAQEQVRLAWAGLGVRLPAEVLAPGPDYCRQVRVSVSGEKSPSLDDLLGRCEEELERLAQGLPGLAVLSAHGRDLSYLVASLALGEQGCLAAKVAVTKALLGRSPQETAGLLEQYLEAARVWAGTWEETTP